MRLNSLPLALCLWLLCASGLQAAPLDPQELEVGRVGPLPDTGWGYRIVSIESDTAALIEAITRVRVGREGRVTTRQVIAGPFLVVGIDASRWVDGKQVELPGVFKVVKPRKIRGSTIPALQKVR